MMFRNSKIERHAEKNASAVRMVQKISSIANRHLKAAVPSSYPLSRNIHVSVSYEDLLKIWDTAERLERELS